MSQRLYSISRNKHPLMYKALQIKTGQKISGKFVFSVTSVLFTSIDHLDIVETIFQGELNKRIDLFPLIVGYPTLDYYVSLHLPTVCKLTFPGYSGFFPKSDPRKASICANDSNLW